MVTFQAKKSLTVVNFSYTSLLPIPDPGSKNSNKREGWKKISCHTFFCSQKFHKIENYFIFDMLKKKIWANFPRIIELFTPKISTKISKIWVWDPGSKIRKKPIPDPGSRGQKGTGSRIRIRKIVLKQKNRAFNFWIITLTVFSDLLKLKIQHIS